MEVFTPMKEKIEKPCKIEKNQVNLTTHKGIMKEKIYPFNHNYGYQKRIMKIMEDKLKNIPLILINMKSDSARKEPSIKMSSILDSL